MILSNLKSNFSNRSRKFLLNEGTVLMLKKLYIILKFQNEIMSSKKYEKKEAFKTKYILYTQLTNI